VNQASTFVSYAQNGEDFLLWRMLHDVEPGTYIDIGAYEAETDSVTRAFYERGWSGINIEPVPKLCNALRQCRPRDVNLQIAIGAEEGERNFFLIKDTGLSTLDEAIARRHRDAGFNVKQARVKVRTLSDVWNEFVRGDVHFLKIDVEGAEDEVLSGAAFARQRPWIVVIEAIAPLTRRPTYQKWEAALTQVRYRFVHSDAFNRYYLAEERAALAERLSAPEGPDRCIRAAELVATRNDLPAGSQFDPQGMSFLGLQHQRPSLHEPTSQLCTESQLREPVYRAWCEALAEPPILHRKQWEFVYVLQVLARQGQLAAGRKGLGFEWDREPLAAVMAARGCGIVAADLNAQAGLGRPSVGTRLHALTLDDLNERCLCERDLFHLRVSVRAENINHISRDLENFDFVWSSSVIQHVGSIRNGVRFVANAMRCLKPGGVAVHTMDFNLSSNYGTIEAGDPVVFRRCDIEALAAELEREGHIVAALNFNPGSAPVDRYVDLPPYRPEPHLRLRLDRYVVTSFGLIVRRGP